MSNYVIQDTSLVNIANAIRSKTGESALLTPAEMVAAINSITTGGGSSGGWIKRKEFYETSALDGVGGEIVLGSYVDIDTELAKDKEFVFIFTAGLNQSQSTSNKAIAAWILYYDGKGLVNISSTSPSSPSYRVASAGNINTFSFEVNYDSSTGTNVIRINNANDGTPTTPKYDYHLSNGGYTQTNPTRYVWGNMFYLDESFKEVGEMNIPRLLYWNYMGQNNEIIVALFDKLTFNIISSDMSYAFRNNTAFTNFPTDWRNKTINVLENSYTSGSLDLTSFLEEDKNIKYLPKIVVANTDVSKIAMLYAFRNSGLVKIDNDAIPLSLIATGGFESSCCSYCWRLREVPENFMANNVYISTVFPGQGGRSMCYEMYYEATFLKLVIGAPIFGQTTSTGTSNRFNKMFLNNNALHRLTFYMPNGAVGTMNATNQTIDLSDRIGYFDSTITSSTLDLLEDEDRANVIIINATNNNATVANMLNLNSLAEGLAYSTYNRQSAVETINSLPDTTAAGGGNTIKFKSGAGSGYGDLYNMSNLSAEEIAVATAKGWTVALV